MATEFYICDGLYTWKLQLANGEERNVLASSLQTAIGGVLPAPVTLAERGPAFDGDVEPTAPVLTSLVPLTARLGDANFTLHVNGTGFQFGDQILWNGVPEPTTLVSATELTTMVNMATAAVAMPIPVSVRTPLGLVSNSLTFTLLPPA